MTRKQEGRRMWLAAAALAAVVALLASAGHAGSASESFTYDPAPTELNGKNGGTGWGGAWTANTGVTEVVDPGTPLTYAVPGGGEVDGGDRAVQVAGGNTDPFFRRSLATPITSDVYVSFLLRMDGGTIGDNDFVCVYLGPDQAGPSLGIKGNEYPSTTGTKDLYCRMANNDDIFFTEELEQGEMHFLVARMFNDPDNPDPDGYYNRISLWVDPAYGDANSPDGTAVAGSHYYNENRELNLVDMIGGRIHNLDSSDAFTIDELRVGGSWGDVVAGEVPEPATLALLGLAACGLGGYVRRRRR